jgi:hypothetical protein
MGVRGVDPCFLAPLYDMYVHLKAELSIPAAIDAGHIPLIDSANESSPRGNPILPVKKGVRQGAITSPTAFNNSIVKPQSNVLTTCILLGIDISLVGYVDGVFSLSHFLRGLEENFLQLQCTYHKIGLGFNTDKLSVLLFD